uniref:EGF-like domain-containing protein n=1 Tax=Macrostomum lignano TaxID=282301 RepID=A0A1I8HLK8_9PLAT
MPEATGSTPEAPTPMPEATGSTPEAPTPMPEATGSTPEATTMKPEVTLSTREATGSSPDPTATPSVPEASPTSQESTTLSASMTSEAATSTSMISQRMTESTTTVQATTSITKSASVPTTTVTTSTTTAPAFCLPSSCRFGGRCVNGFCRCRPFRGGWRCEKRRTKVNCRNRMPREIFRDIYRDLLAEITLLFWRIVMEFLLISFRMSASAPFREADFNLQLRGFEKGSVVVRYTLQFDMPDSGQPPMTLDAIKSAIDSGIAAYSSTNSSNLTMEANTTVTAYNYCADSTTPAACSQFANCTLDPSISSYSCSCFTGFRDDDSSAPGTTCTEVCTSSTAYCSGNGICRTNRDARVSCECFSGYSGDSCQTAGLSPTLLAIAIVVPILFVIIVVLIALIVWMHRRQTRFKKAMHQLQTGGAGGGEDREDGGGQGQEEDNWLRSPFAQLPWDKMPRANLSTEHPKARRLAEEDSAAESGGVEGQAYSPSQLF